MYPKSVVGRVIACACAYFGVATSGMLVSVLVDRYQRVYNRKKFCPEQIISLVDPSESEHNEKQDFINKRLSDTSRNLSNREILPPTPAPSIDSPTGNKKSSKNSASSPYVRFFISLNNDETDEKSSHQFADEFLKELTETMKNSDDHIKFKLLSSKTNSIINKISTTNELPLDSEEKM